MFMNFTHLTIAMHCSKSILRYCTNPDSANIQMITEIKITCNEK